MSSLPFFYVKQIDPSSKELELDEETSKHVVQVLRMKQGEKLNLTDGRGNLFATEIINDHKKHCQVRILDPRHTTHASRTVTIGISLLKNSNRFEWFLEKATELGASAIIPLLCHRTEKEKFRMDRMNGILISAMLQSQQTWLPELHEPTDFNVAIEKFDAERKFIASCDETLKRTKLTQGQGDSLILIGPEGDFTKEEVNQAMNANYEPISLGSTRLRTETAGIVATTLLLRE